MTKVERFAASLAETIKVDPSDLVSGMTPRDRLSGISSIISAR